MRKVELQLLVLLVVIVMACTAAFAQHSETLASVKRKYLNQKVVLIGYMADNLAPEPVLGYWSSGKGLGDRWVAEVGMFLPATYKGPTATVIAIQLDKPEEPGKMNAPGEPVDPDEAVNPYLDIVVRFEDGQVAMATAYASTISDELRFASLQNAIAESPRR
jgi:hypothetical protein